MTAAAGGATIPWRRLPRSVRAAALLLVGYGALAAAGAAILSIVGVVAVVRGAAGAPVLAVGPAFALVSVLYFRSAPRLEAGSAVWWLVGLTLATGEGVASYLDGAYFGRGVSVVRTFVFPGVLVAALLWPATVRHVFAAPRAITDLPD